MGTFPFRFEVGDFEGRRFEPVEGLVDTEARFTFIPRPVLVSLGIEPQEIGFFKLASGRRSRYDMAWVRVRLEGGEQPTIVVFGGAESQPRLGSFTLEGFGLGVDALNERLVPRDGYLMRNASGAVRSATGEGHYGQETQAADRPHRR